MLLTKSCVTTSCVDSNLLHNDGLYRDTGYANLSHGGYCYQVRHITLDESRNTEYQRLRAEIFVKLLGWSIPLDKKGRERDHYDEVYSSAVTIHCVYALHQQKYYLLGGIRIHEINSWDESMLWNEFRLANMIPPDTLLHLQETYNVRETLELTRFCARRSNEYDTRFDLSVVRDYTYASVYAYAECAQRRYALALVHRGYFLVLLRSHFVFDTLYTHFEGKSKADAYALIMIDLVATISKLHTTGQHERAHHMMALCHRQSWMSVSS